MNGYDFDSYESKDELYTDGEGTFLNEMILFLEKKKYLFKVTLSDKTLNENYFVFCFGEQIDNWEFGFNYTLICIREKIKMKHVVKCTVVVETESTDLKEIAKLGLEDIIKRVNDEFVVVDVYRNCTAVEMICVHNKDMKNGKTEQEKGKN